MKLPVLALTGLLNDERLWHQQASALGSDHPFTVVSSASHDSIAALATAALTHAPAARFALAGFSLGGYVALEVMRQAPHRVAALALVDTGARPDTPQAVEWRKGAIAAARNPSGSGEVFAGFLPRVVHPAHVKDARLIELLRSMAETVGADGFIRQQIAAMSRPDSRPLLPSISCPTVIVCGREDQTTPLELSEEMAAAIPAARLVVIEESGHMTPLEQPVAVTDALRAWLSLAGDGSRQ